MGDTLRKTLATTPGLHEQAGRLEQSLLSRIVEENHIPEDEAGRARMVAETAHRIGIADNLRAELQSQVDVEWRIHRKESGARDGLLTAGDIKRAETAFKEARFSELAEARMVSNDVLNLPPSPAEQEAAQLARIRERAEREERFHQNVNEIGKRGSKPGERDRGEHVTEEQKAYKAAYAKAEADAAFGEFADVRSAYWPNAVEPEPQVPAADDAWPDPFGPILR